MGNFSDRSCLPVHYPFQWAIALVVRLCIIEVSNFQSEQGMSISLHYQFGGSSNLKFNLKQIVVSNVNYLVSSCCGPGLFLLIYCIFIIIIIIAEYVSTRPNWPRTLSVHRSCFGNREGRPRVAKDWDWEPENSLSSKTAEMELTMN